MTAGAAPRISVVVATHDRAAGLARLLGGLARQTLPAELFEVVVVDDGSRPPAREALAGAAFPFRLELLQQENAGAAVARHRGAVAARGEVLVVTDDDMEVPPGWLAAHLALHAPGTRRVVLGRMRASPAIDRMPLFERFHANALHKHAQDEQPAPPPLRGNHLCTGNVSLRRADYLAVGGFDPGLARSEDQELGLRLEEDGVELVFSEAAYTVHHSDHTDFAVWRRRAFDYGRYDLRIARKHPALAHADPWRFFFRNAAAKRPFVATTLAVPAAGRLLADVVLGSAVAADRVGLERLAIQATSLLWDLEYFRGLRAEVGGVLPLLRSCADYLEKLERSGERGPERSGGAAVLLRAVAPLVPGAGRAVAAGTRR